MPGREDERGDCTPCGSALESVLPVNAAKAKMGFLSTFHKAHFFSLVLGMGPKNMLLFRYDLDKAYLIRFNRAANN